MAEIVKYTLAGFAGYCVVAIVFILFFYESVLNRKEKKERNNLYNYLLNNPLPEPTCYGHNFRFDFDDKYIWAWDGEKISLFDDKGILMCSFCGDIPAKIKMKKIKKIIKEKTNG